jgi:3-hydroxyisobutyrate dehydrogenase-like beta-hydroxyacid dehydrogenase
MPIDGATPAPCIGVVGLGRMGAAILPRLASTVRVEAHDIDAGRADQARRAGARWHADLRSLARGSDVFVTVLPGLVELEAVMAEVLPELGRGTLWIDLTSGDPRVTRDLAQAAEARGIDVVSAPMGGSIGEAQDGTLTFSVGGAAAAVARARPVLEVLSAPDGIRVAGGRPEDGQTTKLLANALWFANVAAAGEALLIGRALGLEPEHLHALLARSAGSSVALTDHLVRILDGDHLETFGVDRIVEELDTVQQLAVGAGVPAAVLTASAQLQRDALDAYGPVLGELLGTRLQGDRSGGGLRRPHHPEHGDGIDDVRPAPC